MTTRLWWWLTVVTALALAILTLLVLRHTLDSLDVRIRRDLNPSGEFGSRQNFAFDVADWLRPIILMAVFATVAVLSSLVRRSVRPLVYAGLLALAAAVTEMGFKWVLPRVEGSGGLTGTSSFPSGHLVCAVVVPGGLLLMLVARTRWWQWLLAAVLPVAMVVLVLVAELHWVTDVLGGILLGIFLLAASALTPLRPLRKRPDDTGTRQAEAQPAHS